MRPQDVARTCKSNGQVAAFTPQHLSLGRYLYIFMEKTSSLWRGYTRFTSYPSMRQAGGIVPMSVKRKTRRDRCPSTSKPFWLLDWLQPLQPVLRKSPLKNMWSSSLRRFPQNQRIPANISKRIIKALGQAAMPARGHTADLAGGVTC